MNEEKLGDHLSLLSFYDVGIFTISEKPYSSLVATFLLCMRFLSTFGWLNQDYSTSKTQRNVENACVNWMCKRAFSVY